MVTLGIAGVAVALGTAAYLVHTHSDQAPKPPDQDPITERSVPLKGAATFDQDPSPSNTGHLEAEIAPSAPSATQPLSTLSSAAETPRDRANVSSQQKVDERRQALAAAHREILERTLERDGIDAAWAEAAQAKLTAAYGSAEVDGVNVVDAECRSAICRVTLTLEQPGKAGERQIRLLMDRPSPWPASRFLQLDRASGSAVVFIMREGYALPELPAETAGEDF